MHQCALFSTYTHSIRTLTIRFNINRASLARKDIPNSIFLCVVHTKKPNQVCLSPLCLSPSLSLSLWPWFTLASNDRWNYSSDLQWFVRAKSQFWILGCDPFRNFALKNVSAPPKMRAREGTWWICSLCCCFSFFSSWQLVSPRRSTQKTESEWRALMCILLAYVWVWHVSVVVMFLSLLAWAMPFFRIFLQLRQFCRTLDHVWRLEVFCEHFCPNSIFEFPSLPCVYISNAFLIGHLSQ